VLMQQAPGEWVTEYADLELPGCPEQLEYRPVTVELLQIETIVLQGVIKKLMQLFDVKNFDIDQPIILEDVRNTIYTTNGVMALSHSSTQDTSVIIKSMSGVINNRNYSDISFDVPAHTVRGMVVPEQGAIFQVRYPEVDIIGRAI